MEPFSPTLLTILVLICISWTGITFIAVLIIFIIFLCKKYSKYRGSKFIRPIRTPSTISLENQSGPITPAPVKYLDHEKTRYDTHTIPDEPSYSNQQNRYQQQEYMRDDNDETTTTTATTNDVRMYTQRPQKRLYQSVKPLADIRVTDRHTPYPADVIARDRLMNYTRFSAENKY
jgi:hypothetical protein